MMGALFLGFFICFILMVLQSYRRSFIVGVVMVILSILILHRHMINKLNISL